MCLEVWVGAERRPDRLLRSVLFVPVWSMVRYGTVRYCMVHSNIACHSTSDCKILYHTRDRREAGLKKEVRLPPPTEPCAWGTRAGRVSRPVESPWDSEIPGQRSGGLLLVPNS